MVMDRLQIIPLLAGSLLIIMGVAVGIGWLWPLTSLVQVLPGLAAMSFSSAVCFALAGIALILRTLSSRLQQIALLLGAAISAIASFNLLAVLSGSSLDIEQAIRAWFNPTDSLTARMSVPTAIAFLLGGAALCISKRWRYAKRFINFLGAAVFTIGAMATLGYMLSLEPLYHWYDFSYMTAYTAIGMMFLGAGLLFTGLSTDLSTSKNILSYFQFSDGGVVAIAIAVLLGTSLSVGVASWITEQKHLVTVLGNGLQLAQHARAAQIATILQLRSTRAGIIANRPNLLKNLRLLNTKPDALEPRNNILGVLRSFEPFSFSGIAIYGVDGRELVRDGALIDDAKLTVALSEGTSDLVWRDGFYLRKRMPVRDEFGELGTIVAEQALVELNAAVLDDGELGGGDELMLCAAQQQVVHCFPTTRENEPYVLPDISADRQRLAAKALRNESAIETVRDFHDRDVVAAFGPVGNYGLFTVLKAGTQTLYQPMLQQFERTAALLLVLIALGVWLIYTRVRPLVHALRVSERNSQAALKESIVARIAADDANHAKSLFLSSMSHELRTPLNGVLGYVQMLQDNPSTSADQQRQLDAIESCGQHLLSLINDVLDLSKIESGRIDIEETNCNLYDLLESVSDIVRQRAQSKDLQYNLDIDKSVPPFVRIDDVKLRQILVNLLGNAIKFTERGNIVLRVSTRMDNRELLFQVRDTGIGIPAEKQQEIFQPFRQIGRSAGGTGLGLSISQRLCEAMGGMLLVQSSIGEGSCFSVNLPLVLGEAVKITEPLTAMHPIIDIGAQTITVLVADDNAINRQVLTSMLRANGFATDEVENGQEAIAALHQYRQEQPYALVLMDVRMPVMDGLTATRAIKADPLLRDTKIIVVSASVSTETIKEMLAAGCDDFIKKPVRVRELLKKVAQHLNLPLHEVQSNHSVQNQSH